jgi:hypothetical protein
MKTTGEQVRGVAIHFEEQFCKFEKEVKRLGRVSAKTQEEVSEIIHML